MFHRTDVAHTSAKRACLCCWSLLCPALLSPGLSFSLGGTHVAPGASLLRLDRLVVLRDPSLELSEQEMH